MDTDALDRWVEAKLGLKEAHWLSPTDVIELVSEGVLSSSFALCCCA